MGSWIAIALGRDVPPETTRSVIVDGAEVVVWRGADGSVHAWEDRCPHRGMRLSFGFVRGNAINCLYHGWEYGSGAQCIRVPAHPDLAVPPTIRANAYAVREQGGFVWMNFDRQPADEPPPAPANATPLASVAFDAGLDAIRAVLGVDPVVTVKAPGAILHFAAHGVTADRAMVHALAEGGAEQAWLFLKTLRQSIESERAA